MSCSFYIQNKKDKELFTIYEKTLKKIDKKVKKDKKVFLEKYKDFESIDIIENLFQDLLKNINNSNFSIKEKKICVLKNGEVRFLRENGFCDLNEFLKFYNEKSDEYIIVDEYDKIIELSRFIETINNYLT